MIDMQLIFRVLGPDALTHLHVKYDGAENSEVGRRYELSVVAFEILVRALACRPEGVRRGNPDEVHVRQGARIFVDDVVIERPRIERYIQVKHVNDLRWSYRGLAKDFTYMRLLSHHHHVKISAVLVTAGKDQADKLLKTRHDYGISNARVRHRDDHENLPRLFSYLHRLSNIYVDAAGISAIIRYVESVWFFELHRHATLSAIMLAAHERSRGVVRSLRITDPEITALLDHVNALDDGLRVAADGSTLIVQWVDGQKRFAGKEYPFEWEDLRQAFATRYPTSAKDFWRICTSV
ncbi:hypothetical protein [Sinorhizobium terangae]|uniref:hypothetical protein n=1 Tax=Sinorhizobium terangae TaxID=110322 RepID=UPI0024B16138|nr:hypothetical protein [Sinorhizobium terangae]WFU49133.1 hypothetical protein QA637_06965 [Sinorhizobium terangae]